MIPFLLSAIQSFVRSATIISKCILQKRETFAFQKKPHVFTDRRIFARSKDPDGLAGSQYMSGQGEEARDTLLKAGENAEFFDASPSYDESDIRFITRIEGTSAHDDLGTTAMDGIALAVGQFDQEELTALWNSIRRKGISMKKINYKGRSGH